MNLNDVLRCVSIPFIAGQWSLPPATFCRGGASPEFQSPSLRGSGRFRYLGDDAGHSRRVSIPFIAGQWSLRAHVDRGTSSRTAGFNPLHCGAVVASKRLNLTPRR